MTFVAGGALKPIGGHILSHASATRMFLRKGLFHRVIIIVSHTAALLCVLMLSDDQLLQAVLKNVLPNWSIVLIAPNPRLRTSWMRVAGQMCNYAIHISFFRS
jgi:hypothetical protein